MATSQQAAEASDSGDKVVSVRFTDRHLRAIRNHAKRDGESVSSWIRQRVVAFLKATSINV